MLSLAKTPPILYLIATIAQGGEDGALLTEIATVVRKEAGPNDLTLLVQLRDQGAAASSLLKTARSWNKILASQNAYVLINERTDVVITSGAVGVHLGKESYSLADARTLLPEGLLAYSAHSAEEAVQASKTGADLITLSPIFSSPGKGEPIGLEPLRQASEKCPEIPVLALGGIRPENVKELLEAGAAGVAVIGAVFREENPVRAACKLARHLCQTA